MALDEYMEGEIKRLTVQLMSLCSQHPAGHPASHRLIRWGHSFPNASSAASALSYMGMFCKKPVMPSTL